MDRSEVSELLTVWMRAQARSAREICMKTVVVCPTYNTASVLTREVSGMQWWGRNGSPLASVLCSDGCTEHGP